MRRLAAVLSILLGVSVIVGFLVVDSRSESAAEANEANAQPALQEPTRVAATTTLEPGIAQVATTRASQADDSVEIEVRFRSTGTSHGGPDVALQPATLTPLVGGRWLISDLRFAAGDARTIWQIPDFGLEGVIERTSGRELRFEGRIWSCIDNNAIHFNCEQICTHRVTDLQFIEALDGSTWTAESPCRGEFDLVLGQSELSTAERLGCTAVEPEYAHSFSPLSADIDGDDLDERIILTDYGGTRPIVMRVLFDDGSEADLVVADSGLVDAWGFAQLAFEDVRPIGLGHDAVAITSRSAEGSRHTVLVDFNNCEPRVLSLLQLGGGTGMCITDADDDGLQEIRRWRWPSAGVASVDEMVHFDADGSEVAVPTDGPPQGPPCGPVVPSNMPSGPGTELDGTHRVQIGTEPSPGELFVRFRAQGNDRYFVHRVAGADEEVIDLGGPLPYLLTVAAPYGWFASVIPGPVRLNGNRLEGFGDLLNINDGDTETCTNIDRSGFLEDDGATFAVTACDFTITLEINTEG